MSKDTQSRKWLLTINNPVEKGFTHEHIKELLADMKSVVYWCMADEVGGHTNTYHTHLFICSRSGIRFSTIDKRFKGGNYQMCKGTAQQNMEYVSKTGKHEKTDKHETRVEGTFEEWGDMPIERQGSRADVADLYDMVRQGLSDYQILEEMPEAMLKLDHIDRTRQIIHQDRFKDTFRELKVVYIFGEGGLGKTRHVMEKYGYSNVYRITDYSHPFDNYRGQDVVFFDEFRSEIPLSLMLQYLDGYPLELPCRYNNKWACYTKVYIASNYHISEQYSNIRKEHYGSWLALIRRIHEVRQYRLDGVHVHDINMVHDGWHLNFKGIVPFDRGVEHA